MGKCMLLTHGKGEKPMSENDVLRYLQLANRKLIILTSGRNWKPEYELELKEIDEELARLRKLIDKEHSRHRQAAV